MSELVEALASYVPELVLRRLRHDPSPPREPSRHSIEAVVAFFDINGFTKITHRFTEQGANGGEVVKFAGDAMVTLWEQRDGVSLEEAALRAACCALAIQAWLTRDRETSHEPLSVHAGRIQLTDVLVSAEVVGAAYERAEYPRCYSV